MTTEAIILMHMNIENRNIPKDKNKILSALKCEQVMICLGSKSNMNTIIKIIIIT